VLKVAGFRMHAAYRSQFLKLLQYIDSHFLSALGASNDPDARAVYTRWVACRCCSSG
jgi:nucleoporin GLE1